MIFSSLPASFSFFSLVNSLTPLQPFMGKKPSERKKLNYTNFMRVLDALVSARTLILCELTAMPIHLQGEQASWRTRWLDQSLDTLDARPGEMKHAGHCDSMCCCEYTGRTGYREYTRISRTVLSLVKEYSPVAGDTASDALCRAGYLMETCETGELIIDIHAQSLCLCSCYSPVWLIKLKRLLESDFSARDSERDTRRE